MPPEAANSAYILHLSQQSSAQFYASLSQSKTILKIWHFVSDLKYWVTLVLKIDVTPTISNEACFNIHANFAKWAQSQVK